MKFKGKKVCFSVPSVLTVTVYCSTYFRDTKFGPINLSNHVKVGTGTPICWIRIIILEPDPYHFFKSEILPDSLKNYTDPHSNTKGYQTILKIEINFVYDSIFSVKERKNARILYATALNFHNTVFFRKPNPYNLLFCLDPDQCHFAWKADSGSNLKFNYWKRYKKMDTRTVPACFSHVSHKLWTAMRDSYQRQIFRLISKAVWLVRC